MFLPHLFAELFCPGDADLELSDLSPGRLFTVKAMCQVFPDPGDGEPQIGGLIFQTGESVLGNLFREFQLCLDPLCFDHNIIQQSEVFWERIQGFLLFPDPVQYLLHD